MQFQTPQFIDIEDKVFGKLTVKQAIYLAGGGGASFALWVLLPIYLAVPLIALVAAFAVALAFLKINGLPFIETVQAAFYFVLRDKLYLWKKQPRIRPKQEVETMKQEGYEEPTSISTNKLRDMSWGLEVKDPE